MSFVTFVSGRYLRTRQKRAFISLITALSIAGVTVGVMALIVVIAVMAGFESDLKSRIMGIRPHLVITKNQGPFTGYDRVLQKVETITGIEKASAFITTQVVLRTTSRAAGAMLKGIDALQKDSGISGVDTSKLVNPVPPKGAPQVNDQLPGIILGKELAANLGVIRGDTVYMISPRGMLSPVGHIPAMIKFQVVRPVRIRHV
jgi:lipoprotein-releasing system permease protein